MEYETLPESLNTALREHCSTEDILVAASTDITGAHMTFGEEWIIATNKELFTYAMQGDGPSLLSRHALADIRKIEVVSLVGTGVVEVEIAEKRHRLVTYSHARNADISGAVEHIRALIEKKPYDPNTENDPKPLCEKCGRPIAEGLNKCPRCTMKGKTLLRILVFVRPYGALMSFLLAAMVGGTCFGLATPYLSKLFIDFILKPDAAGGFPHARWLPLATLALLIAHVGQLFLGAIHSRLAGTLGFRTVHDVRAALYRKLQDLSLSYFDKHQTGAIMARVNQDTGDLQRFLVDFIPLTVESLLTLLGVGVFLFVFSWKLTMLILLPIFASVLFLRYIFSRIHIFFRRYFHRRSRLSALVGDALSGMRVIKAFGQENDEIDKFDMRSGQYRDAGIHLVHKWSVYHPVLHFFIMSGTVLVWFIGGREVIGGAMTLGSVVAYSGYLAMFYRPVFILTRMIELITNSLAAAERIFDVIDTEPEIMDAPDAISIPKINGKIELRSVSFGYDKYKPVIKELSVTIEPNEIVGLVGKSGAGKSTIINLICRLYQADKGKVLLDGTDVCKIQHADIRSQIGLVLQETFLFNGTIYENIVYARKNATPEQVIDAAIAANAHEFIIEKPDGYDTEVGERGDKLSTGEKQRVAIARAILRDPRILILDEATSSVDTETEKKIQEALELLMKSRTTIAIAHRLSTLRNCDRLLVIDDGRLAEQGTHDELMKKKGIFHRLITVQKELSQLVAVDG